MHKHIPWSGSQVLSEFLKGFMEASMYELRQLVKGDKLNGLINVAATKAKHFHSKGRVRGCCFVLFISKLWLEMQFMYTNHFTFHLHLCESLNC